MAVNDFQNGRIGWGIVNTALAVSDVFLVGTVVKSVAKLGMKGTMQVAKSSWSGVRRKYGELGIVLKGQHMHHPIKQRRFGNNPILKGILNQPFMVTKLSKSAVKWRGVEYKMHEWHMLLDGRSVRGVTMTMAQRAYYGTNAFHKSLGFSGVGHVGTGFQRLRNGN
ncbi:MAG: hypothetical protein SFX74_04795 [Fimbriimonadaceae bacterium]|nr:hypothetical protein [Fimbriimonadaceae bacterium]